MSTSYPALLHRLLHTNLYGGIKLGLNNPFSLDAVLNYPSQQFRSIHIAGTNGKGSVSTKVAAACQAAGWRTGLYTSPHIACFRERIKVNGTMIPEEAAESGLQALFALVDTHHIPATFFEITTLLAFLHFANEKVDIGIIETGLGGRLDATNILTPLLSVITSISLDHTEILGQTVEAIAQEKAGIIKPGIPVVIGPRVPLPVIQAAAETCASQVHRVTGMFDDYHQENTAIARKAMDVLKLPSHAIDAGIDALPPCRLESVDTSSNTVILDVAHNPDGLNELFQAIKQRHPQKALSLVFGLSSNKDVASCLAILLKHGTTFHLVEGTNGRAVPKAKMKQMLIAMGANTANLHCAPSITDGVVQGISDAKKCGGIVVVCGTFFIMAEARKALGIIDPQDPFDLNER